MPSHNNINVDDKYKLLKEEYTVLLRKYMDVEKNLKRYNLSSSDLLSVEKMHRLLFAYSSSDVIWLMDLHGKSTYVSSSILKFTGYTEKEYLAQTIEERFVPESAEKAKIFLFYRIEDYKKQLSENPNTSFNVELEYRCKDGSTKWGELNITPVFDEHGDFVAISGLTKDISLQIRETFLTSQKEQEYTDLLDHIPNMVLIYQDNLLVYANKTGKEALDIVDIPNLKIDVFSNVKEDQKPFVRDVLNRRALGEKIDKFEIDVIDGQNRSRHVIVRPTNVVFNSKPSLLFLIIDITTQVETEKIIIESELKFRTLADSSPNAIMIYQDDFWVYANPAASTISGYTIDELYRMRYWDFIHPDDQKLANEKSESRGIQNFVDKIEYRVITKNGVVKWMSVIGNIIDFNGKSAVLINAFDITIHKIKDAELEEAKNRAEASDRLKTAFLNNISHEIRTPLNGILNFGEMIIDPTESDEDKNMYFQILNQSIDRLLETITNYTDISLIVSKNAVVCEKVFEINSFVEKLKSKFESAIAEKSLDFSFSLNGFSDGMVKTDEDVFEKIIAHLISNSIKFTPKFGILNVHIDQSDNLIHILVEDNGEGISESSISEILLPFTQGDYSTSRKFEGSGLGLAIVKGYVELLNGSFNIKSGEGKGMKFSIQFPVKNTKQPKMTNTENILNVNTTDPILIVEDEITNRLFLRLLLEKSGFNVVEVTDGKQAVDAVKIGHFSMILMDLKMPVMDGLEATRLIKEFNPSVPVIAITAHAMSGDEQKALDAGCNSYLPKPINKDSLFGKFKEFGLR